MTNHVKSLAARGDPAHRLPSARQATLAVAGSQTGSRNGYIEQEWLFCKIVLGVISPLLLNIALHGMEAALGVKHDAQGTSIGKRAVVRYADDCAPRRQERRIAGIFPECQAA
jgi:hypothetical protein